MLFLHMESFLKLLLMPCGSHTRKIIHCIFPRYQWKMLYILNYFFTSIHLSHKPQQKYLPVAGKQQAMNKDETRIQLCYYRIF